MAVQEHGIVIYEFTRNDAGKHSFQIRNGHDGRLVYSQPVWYNTREEVNQFINEICDKFIEDILSRGGRIVTKTEGRLEFTVPMHDGRLVILGALMRNPDGKYGVLVITNQGHKLLEPERWFDSPQEAYEESIRQRDRIDAAVKAAGLGSTTIESSSTVLAKLAEQLGAGLPPLQMPSSQQQQLPPSAPEKPDIFKKIIEDGYGYMMNKKNFPFNPDLN